jgi:hypothetical protein
MNKTEAIEFIKEELIEQLDLAYSVFEDNTKVEMDYDIYERFVNEEKEGDSLDNGLTHEMSKVPDKDLSLLDDVEYFFGTFCGTADLDVIKDYLKEDEGINLTMLWELGKFEDVLTILVSEFVKMVPAKFDLLNDLKNM